MSTVETQVTSPENGHARLSADRYAKTLLESILSSHPEHELARILLHKPQKYDGTSFGVKPHHFYVESPYLEVSGPGLMIAGVNYVIRAETQSRQPHTVIIEQKTTDAVAADSFKPIVFDQRYPWHHNWEYSITPSHTTKQDNLWITTQSQDKTATVLYNYEVVELLDTVCLEILQNRLQLPKGWQICKLIETPYRLDLIGSTEMNPDQGYVLVGMTEPESPVELWIGGFRQPKIRPAQIVSDERGFFKHEFDVSNLSNSVIDIISSDGGVHVWADLLSKSIPPIPIAPISYISSRINDNYGLLQFKTAVHAFTAEGYDPELTGYHPNVLSK